MKASVASLYQAVELHQEIPPLLIGERCNPNGSKAFREALLAEDWEACLKIALDQEARGAQVIDLCVAYAGRDEAADMERLTRLFAGSCKAPLMFDSTSPETLEQVLPLYPGRAIINSINLEDGGSNLERICRLAKKYGAAVVALTIDLEGMALTCERKLAVAREIYERAVEGHGLRPQDILFDLLTFTVGSGDEAMRDAAVETLEAIRRVKQELPGVGFTLGVSNVSFGLRPAARRVLNSVFLHEAVTAGLNTAIVDAAKVLPYAAIDEQDRQICLDLLYNRHPDALMTFIEHFEKAVDAGTEDAAESALPAEELLRQKVLKGDKEGLEDLLSGLRGRWQPLAIINDLLVPAMREVGDLFGRGELLLPFVLQSAEVMKQSVALLEPYMEKLADDGKTSVLLATVAGDVHDIGKNLVDIILSNNGYKVHNLGIKVPAEEIIAKARELQVDVVGLSGLLVKSALLMKDNLEQFATSGLQQPILLGGAALTQKFVAQDCVPRYAQPVVYCADAFAGLKAIREFEAGRLVATEWQDRPEANRPSLQVESVDRSFEPPVAPFLGHRVVSDVAAEPLFDYLNEAALFRGRWGYRRGKMSREDYEHLQEETVLPLYRRLREQSLNEGWLQPRVSYGYFSCVSDGDRLLVSSPSGDQVFRFPRQASAPGLCIADYFRTAGEGGDVAGFFVVTIGSRLGEITRELYEQDRYHDYLMLHGLGVELTDALAEYWHEQMRIELGIQQEKGDMSAYVAQGYQGSRYGFGYPSCPDLEAHDPVFALLQPQQIGVELTESFEMVPEMTTSAIVVHHPQAKYFAV